MTHKKRRAQASELRDYTVGLVAEMVVPERLNEDGWRMAPLQFPDTTYAAAVNTVLTLTGDHATELPADKAPPLDACVITVLERATDADSAIDAATDRLSRLADAVGYRQYGQGRKLAFVAWGHGEVSVSMPYTHRAQLSHEMGEGESPAKEITWIAGMLSEPRASALVRLFLDALRDPSLDGSLARLWSLFETLAEKFTAVRFKKQKVVAAVRHAGIKRGADFDRAYALRNQFVHEGLVGDPMEVGGIRDELAFTAWLVLAHSRFAPVDPAADPWDEKNPNPPIRKVRLSQPHRHQQATDKAR